MFMCVKREREKWSERWNDGIFITLLAALSPTKM